MCVKTAALPRGAVVHHYHDHRTGQHRQQTLPQEEMIRRYISHIRPGILKWCVTLVFVES
ncbi:transposase (plasmid) [Arsenophonus nasoniae]|nr:transposase [Arsenophonus nasoniae]WGM18175.1 transposase [Arsenophonus nasoniae]